MAVKRQATAKNGLEKPARLVNFNSLPGYVLHSRALRKLAQHRDIIGDCACFVAADVNGKFHPVVVVNDRAPGGTVGFLIHNGIMVVN